MPIPKKPVILFIEDEQRHFQQISHHLLGYHCIQIGTKELGQVEQRARELQPVAAVVDLILYTGNLDAIRADIVGHVKWFEDYVLHGRREPAPTGAQAAKVQSGADSIAGLRRACPGLHILLCSQLHAGHADADRIAKDLDERNNVRNAEAIAAAVRKVIGG